MEKDQGFPEMKDLQEETLSLRDMDVMCVRKISVPLFGIGSGRMVATCTEAMEPQGQHPVRWVT